MLLVGLTGGVACGKSTTLRLVGAHPHCALLDLDALYHQLVRDGEGPLLGPLRQAFGEQVVVGQEQDGQLSLRLDRQALGQLVFHSEEARKKLNQLTHPAIFKELVKKLLWHWLIGTRIVIVESPLLFETKGLRSLCQHTVVVYTPPELQLQRLLLRNPNLTEEEALLRIKSQMSLETKRELATLVIDNSGDLEHLQVEVDRVLHTLQRSSRWWLWNSGLILLPVLLAVLWLLFSLLW